MTIKLTPNQIQRYGSRLCGEQLLPLLPIRWQQQRAMRLLSADGTEGAVKALAEAVVKGRALDAKGLSYLIRALGGLQRNDQRTVICEVINAYCSVSKTMELVALLRQDDDLPDRPQGSRVAIAFACCSTERIAAGEPEVVVELLPTWDEHSAHGIAVKAFHALSLPASIDALCRHWMEYGETEDALACFLLESGHAPADPSERALFWLMIGELERYEELDSDGTLLGACCT